MPLPAGLPPGPPADPALPPQERGRLRRTRILAAAADLVDSTTTAGRRSITLRALAEAAEVPVASLYHYFPDMDSVLAAVAAGYGARLTSRIEAAIEVPADSPGALLQVVVDAYREFFAARPGLRELWFDRRASAQVVAVHRDYRARMAGVLHDRMRGFGSAGPDPLTYTMLFEMVGALWELAFDLDGEGQPRVVAETWNLATRFLGRRIGFAVPSPHRAADGATPDPPAPTSPTEEPRPWLSALPPQERGRRRRAEILTAASSVIDREGPHGASVTIRGITDAAGCAPASVYRYFRDLESLVAAVADRYMDGLLALTTEPDDGQAALDREVAAHRDLLRAHPGLRRLWFDRRSSPAIHEMHAYYRRARADRLRAVLARLGLPPRTQLELEMHVAIVEALWELAFTLDPDGHPEVLAEIEELARELRHPARSP